MVTLERAVCTVEQLRVKERAEMAEKHKHNFEGGGNTSTWHR